MAAGVPAILFPQQALDMSVELSGGKWTFTYRQSDVHTKIYQILCLAFPSLLLPTLILVNSHFITPSRRIRRLKTSIKKS